MTKEEVLNIIIEYDYNSSNHRTYLTNDKINLSSIAKYLDVDVNNVRSVINSKGKYISKYDLYLELEVYEEIVDETIKGFKQMIKGFDNYIDDYQI